MWRSAFRTTLLLCPMLLRGGEGTGVSLREKSTMVQPSYSYNDSFSTSRTGRVALAAALIERREAGRMMGTLLDFLVATSGGRQVLLLHDHTMPDAGVWCYRAGVEVTVFPYSNSTSEKWVEALSTGRGVEGGRKVVVVCSTSHTLNIFQQVLERSLESTSLRWFVVLQEDVTDQLLSILREGTQVAMAVSQGGTEGSYQLYSTYVGQDNTFRLKKAGNWMWSAEDGEPKIHPSSSQLHPPLLHLYSDFGGRKLRAAVVDNWPFFSVKNNSDGSLLPDGGIDINLLDTLGKKLNFTYIPVKANDSEWGEVLENGTGTGMVGLVARHEADIAVNEITVTEVRETLVDFTLPYFLDNTALVSQAPAVRNRAFAVLSPFTFQEWVCIAAALMVMGPFLYTLSRLRSKLFHEASPHTLASFCFNVGRAIVNQDTRSLPTDFALRLAFFFWFIFCITFYAMYAATLTAELARPSHDHPIESLTDLLTAARDRSYTPVVVKGTAIVRLFKKAEAGIYRNIWEVFDPDESFVDTYTAGVEKVLTGKYVFLNGLFGAEIRAVKMGRHRFHFGRETFFPQAYAIACTRGSPLKMVFERLLYRVSWAGLVKKWTKDETDQVSRMVADGMTEVPRAITIKHLQAAFFILLMGYTLSCLSFLLERVHHNYLAQRRLAEERNNARKWIQRKI